MAVFGFALLFSKQALAARSACKKPNQKSRWVLPNRLFSECWLILGRSLPAGSVRHHHLLWTLMKLYFIGFLHELLRRHRRLLGVLLLGVFLPWAIFLKVSSEIREGEGFYGDLQALRWLHAHATPTLDTLNLLLSRAGGPLVMAGLSGLIAGGLLWWRQRRKAWFFGVAFHSIPST